MNPWDDLSRSFDTHQKPRHIDPSAADNILIAWPTLFEGIKKVQSSGKGLTAFDLGCGTGSFSEALRKNLYRVTASDTSPKMLKIARPKLGKVISFHLSGHEAVTSFKDCPFALITSVMVFQFIQKIDKALDDLTAALRPGGVIAFAVFNPDHVRINIGREGGFVKTMRAKHGTNLFMSEKGINIPVYIRTEHEYDALLRARGFSRVLVKRPRFRHAFLKKYPQMIDTRFSEYLIMVYRKSGTFF